MHRTSASEQLASEQHRKQLFEFPQREYQSARFPRHQWVNNSKLNHKYIHRDHQRVGQFVKISEATHAQNSAAYAAVLQLLLKSREKANCVRTRFGDGQTHLLNWNNPNTLPAVDRSMRIESTPLPVWLIFHIKIQKWQIPWTKYNISFYSRFYEQVQCGRCIPSYLYTLNIKHIGKTY